MADASKLCAAVLDTVANLVVVLDNQGRIVLFNRACAAATGYTAEEACCRHVWDFLLVPEEVEDVRNVFAELRAGQFPNQHENYWVAKDGTRRLIAWSNTAVTGPGGVVTHVIATGSDITGLRMAERRLALRDRVTAIMVEPLQISSIGRHLLQAICEAVQWQVGELWLWDEKAGVLRHASTWHEPSPVLASFAEASRARTFPPGVGLPGLAWSAHSPVWVSDIATDPSFARSAQAREAGLRSAFALQIVADDAALAVMLFFNRESRPPDPPLLETLKAIGTCARLLMERTRAAGDLRDRETRMRAIVETAVDAIVTIDEQGRVDSFNPAAERLFGYSRSEVLGQSVAILMPSPDREQHGTYLSNYLATGHRKIIGIGREVVGRRKDGTTFPVHLSITEMNLGRRMFTGIFTDLSQIKQMQEELVRNRSLAAIGETAATIAHEIKNPLAALSQPMQVLRDDMPADDPRREVLEAMLGQVKRLDQTVHQLLFLARPWNPKKETCDLTQVVRRVISMTAEQRSFERIRFRQEEREPLHVAVDPALFEQVLWNLALNAAEAMPRGGEVGVSYVVTEKAVLVRVADTGPGLRPEVQAKLFQPFFTTKPSGNGLGLAICRKIMEAHGGSLSMESEAGKGTTATLSFPRD